MEGSGCFLSMMIVILFVQGHFALLQAGGAKIPTSIPYRSSNCGLPTNKTSQSFTSINKPFFMTLCLVLTYSSISRTLLILPLINKGSISRTSLLSSLENDELDTPSSFRLFSRIFFTNPLFSVLYCSGYELFFLFFVTQFLAFVRISGLRIIGSINLEFFSIDFKQALIYI